MQSHTLVSVLNSTTLKVLRVHWNAVECIAYQNLECSPCQSVSSVLRGKASSFGITKHRKKKS